MQNRLFRGASAALLLSSVCALVAQDGLPATPVMTSLTFGPNANYDLLIVHVNTPGHPTNVVPGLGVPFNAGGSASSAFQNPIYSYDDAHWGINCLTDTTSSDDDCLLVNGVVILREGDQAPWAPIGELVGTIDTNFGLNNSGDVLFGNNLAGTASSTADDDIVLWQAGLFTVLAHEGDPISPFLPAPVGGGAGTWDDEMDGCRLLNDGTPIWHADGVDGLTTGTTNDEFIVIGVGPGLQVGVDVPIGLAGGATDPWQLFDLDDVHVSGDGSLVLIQGDTSGPTTEDDIVTINNVVVLQEGSIIPGSSFAEPIDTSGIVQSWLDGSGSWFARGNNDVTETDWVVRNGIVVADSAGTDEVVTGTGEHWNDADFSDCFFAFDGNDSGAYVIGGVTDAPSDGNGVIVYDDGTGNRMVVVREGEGIDLDGNGLLDDDRFFNTFGNDDVLLLNDGSVVFTATLKNGAGSSVDQGLFRVFPKIASCTQRNGTGVNPLVCDCATLPVLGTTWDVSVTPAANTLATLVFASPVALPGPFPLFGGEALIAPPVVDFGGTGLGLHSVPLPPELLFVGTEFFLQGMRLNLVGGVLEIELTNAVDAVLSNN